MRRSVWPLGLVMSLKAVFAFASFAMVCWIGCVGDVASPSICSSLEMPVRRVGSRGLFFWSQTSHCGLKCAVHFVPIQEAKPSLSQRLSHHAIVTKSPNH